MHNVNIHGSNSTPALPGTQGAGCTGKPSHFKTGLVSLLELGLQFKLPKQGGQKRQPEAGCEEYLGKEAERRKKTKDQQPPASQQDASEADVLEEIDRAVSEYKKDQTSGRRHTSNAPAGLTSLPELVWNL